VHGDVLHGRPGRLHAARHTTVLSTNGLLGVSLCWCERLLTRNAARFVALVARAAMDAGLTNTGHQGDSANERGGGGERGPEVDNAQAQGADACGWCGASEAKQLCSACKAVKYCGKECQVRVHASRQPRIVDGHAAFEHCWEQSAFACYMHLTHAHSDMLIASPPPHPHSHSLTRSWPPHPP
jgi:hypothetical protein